MITKAPNRFVSGSVPELGDNEFQLPPLLMPVSEIPGLLQSINPGAAISQVESFCQDNTQTIAASSAASDANIVTLSAGLWKIILDATVIADYTPANAANIARVSVVAPGSATKSALMFLPFVANVPSRARLELTVNLPSNDWIMQLNFIATAAAQNALYQVSCQGLRLAG